MNGKTMGATRIASAKMTVLLMTLALCLLMARGYGRLCGARRAA